MTPTSSIRTRRLADRYSLLSECLKHPTDQFLEQVREGRLDAELRDHEGAFEDDSAIAAVAAARTEDLRTQYRALFEAFEQPYAPPAESPYKDWYGDRDGGLMGGPPATDMERRYAAIDAEPPSSYPPDHVALLLEYASLLVESGAIEEYEVFLETHMDWVPAFRRLADSAAADAPFYTAVLDLVASVISTERDRHDVAPPSAETIQTMVERAGSTTDDQPTD